MRKCVVLLIVVLAAVVTALTARADCEPKKKTRLWLCNSKSIDCGTCKDIGNGGWTGCAYYHMVPWTKQVCGSEECE